MRTPAEILYTLAGAPPQSGVESLTRRCAICAREQQRTATYAAWQGGNYTDQNKVRAWGAEAICEACIWAHSWTPPPGYVEDPTKRAARDAKRIAEATGREGRTVHLRLFTHLWDERGYVSANKAQKPLIREWLRAPKSGPWFAAISDSGQKHVLPWAPLNVGARGVVRFEDRDVTLGDWALVDEMTELLTAGVTKDEIERGDYRRSTWSAHREAVLGFCERWGPWVSGDWWTLSLWLAQRDEVEHERRTDARREEARVADARGGATGSTEGRVPGGRRESTQTLGSTARPRTRGGADKRNGRTVGDDAAAPARAQRPEQGALFGDEGARGGGR